MGTLAALEDAKLKQSGLDQHGTFRPCDLRPSTRSSRYCFVGILKTFQEPCHFVIKETRTGIFWLELGKQPPNTVSWCWIYGWSRVKHIGIHGIEYRLDVSWGCRKWLNTVYGQLDKIIGWEDETFFVLTELETHSFHNQFMAYKVEGTDNRVAVCFYWQTFRWFWLSCKNRP